MAPVWLISNKYYKAKVTLEVFKVSPDTFEVVPVSATTGSPRIGASVFFAGTFNEAESMKLLDLWQNFVARKWNEADVGEEPEVQLLVVEKFESEAVKAKALQWAIKYGTNS